MSRGPGKVQRGVLAALGRCGRLNTFELTGEVFPMWGYAHLSSTRRALRALEAAGRVCGLGTDLGGVKVWCLAERRHLFTAYGGIREGTRLAELLGKSEGWLSRAFNSSR